MWSSPLDRTVLILAASLSLLVAPGCIVQNRELLQLREDVNELKKAEAARRTSGERLSGELGERLSALERDMASLRGDLGAGLSGLRKEIGKAEADSEARFDSVVTDFRRLQGRFEEIKHLYDRTSSENRAFVETAEERIRAVEERLADMERKVAELGRELTALKLAAAPKEKKKETGVDKRSANEIYKAGLDAVRKGETEEARRWFRRYLKEYPDGPLANNAQFWIGESYYDEKNYERAIIEYDDVIRKYPKGIKVPAALLKQAMAFEKIKDYKTAQALFRKLIKAHPDSEEAKAARKMVKKTKKKKK